MGCWDSVLSHLKGLDWYQRSAISFSLLESLVIVLYFTLRTNPPEVVFVSDLLQQNIEYKCFMTVFVFIQLFFSAMYAWGHRKNHMWTFVLMNCGLLSAFVGWCMLSYVYMDAEQDSVSWVHVAGVMMFVCGSSLYFALMVVDIWADQRVKHTWTKFFMALLSTLLLFSSLGMGAVFMYHFLDKHIVLHSSQSSNSWVFEHVGYLSFVIAHVFFFLDETPNPWGPRKALFKQTVSSSGVTASLFSGVLIGPGDICFASPIERTKSMI